MLTRLQLSNSGGVIFLRALLVTAVLYAVFLGLRTWIDPHRSWNTGLGLALRHELVHTLHYLGAIFAAAYTAFYARFAAQWSYLAGVYNEIKAAEVGSNPRSRASRRALAQWKAAFVEDAVELHLARKPIFATVIHWWLREKAVAKEFQETAPNGARVLGSLRSDVERIWTTHEAGGPWAVVDLAAARSAEATTAADHETS